VPSGTPGVEIVKVVVLALVLGPLELALENTNVPFRFGCASAPEIFTRSIFASLHPGGEGLELQSPGLSSKGGDWSFTIELP
jgi:hypothetical protein